MKSGKRRLTLQEQRFVPRIDSSRLRPREQATLDGPTLKATTFTLHCHKSSRRRRRASSSAAGGSAPSCTCADLPCSTPSTASIDSSSARHNRALRFISSSTRRSTWPCPSRRSTPSMPSRPCIPTFLSCGTLTARAERLNYGSVITKRSVSRAGFFTASGSQAHFCPLL